MKLFLDTNVVLDFVLNRTPFNKDACELIELALSHKFELCISSSSITDIYYILSKKTDKKTALNFTEDLTINFKITDVNQIIIKAAIKLNFNDFEDAVQYQSAFHAKANVIITRNTKDFIKSKIKVFTPLEFTKKYLK